MDVRDKYPDFNAECESETGEILLCAVCGYPEGKHSTICEDIKAGKSIVDQPPCYWDDLLAKQMCPKHGVPVAECPVDLADSKFLEAVVKAIPTKAEIPVGPILTSEEIKNIPRIPSGPLVPDKPHEVGEKVSHYSVHCQNCGHPSLWHWHNEESGQTGKCRAFQCHCLEDIPGQPISPYCDECNHPIRWHDKAGPRCTAVNCSCGRTAA